MELHVGRLAILDADIRVLQGRIVRKGPRMPPFAKLLDNGGGGSDRRDDGFGVKAEDDGVCVNLAVTASNAESSVTRRPPVVSPCRGSYSFASAKRRRGSLGMTRVNTAPLTGSNCSVPGHLVPGSLASHQNPVCSKVVMPSAP